MSDGGDLCCKDLIEFLADYLEGTLAGEQLTTFEEHLKLCAPCVEYLKSYEFTIRQCRDAVPPPICDDSACAEVPDELVEAVKAALRKQDSPE